ncbi:hypothetical protein LV779_29315 [Streptomyces thinghirensis]|nr:hypothetical protein [Streptomyces thinghirensis]
MDYCDPCRRHLNGASPARGAAHPPNNSARPTHTCRRVRDPAPSRRRDLHTRPPCPPDRTPVPAEVDTPAEDDAPAVASTDASADGSRGGRGSRRDRKAAARTAVAGAGPC